MSINPGPVNEPRLSLSNAYSRHDDMAVPAARVSEYNPPIYSRYDDHNLPTGHVRRPQTEYFDASMNEKRPVKPPRNVHNHIGDEDATPPIPEDPISTAHITEPTRAIHVPNEIQYSSEVRSFPSKLQRGLQIPSRMGVISSGFSLPPLLGNQGVSKEQWKLFTHEVKRLAMLSGSQWAIYLGKSVLWGLVWSIPFGPYFGIIPSTIHGYKRQKKLEHENFILAHNSGTMAMCVARWNENYFEPLGLHVSVAPPRLVETTDMDVTSTKLFKYHQKTGNLPTQPGRAALLPDKKEIRYQRREGQKRVEACYKGRIVVQPFDGTTPRLNGVLPAVDPSAPPAYGSAFNDPIIREAESRGLIRPRGIHGRFGAHGGSGGGSGGDGGD